MIFGIKAVAEYLGTTQIQYVGPCRGHQFAQRRLRQTHSPADRFFSAPSDRAPPFRSHQRRRAHAHRPFRISGRPFSRRLHSPGFCHGGVLLELANGARLASCCCPWWFCRSTSSAAKSAALPKTVNPASAISARFFRKRSPETASSKPLAWRTLKSQNSAKPRAASSAKTCAGSAPPSSPRR